MKDSSLGSVGSYIRYGWQQAKSRISQHWLSLLIVAIVVVVLSVIQNSVGSYPTGQVDPFGDPVMALNGIGRLTQLLSWLFGIWYGIGMIKLGLRGADGKSFSFGAMFQHNWSEIWKYIVTAILFTLVLLVPLALLGGLVYLIYQMNPSVGGIVAIIAGIVGLIYALHLVFRISMVLYYVVVDHANSMSPVEMIKHARYMSKGHVSKLFSVGLVAGLTNILGALALGIGLLWTIPLAQIAVAKLYRDIDDKYHSEKDDHAPEENDSPIG